MVRYIIHGKVDNISLVWNALSIMDGGFLKSGKIRGRSRRY